MKYIAPKGCTGIDVGGEYFTVATEGPDAGTITVPDHGNYDDLLRPQGFTPVPASADTAPAE